MSVLDDTRSHQVRTKCIGIILLGFLFSNVCLVNGVERFVSCSKGVASGNCTEAAPCNSLASVLLVATNGDTAVFDDSVCTITSKVTIQTSLTFVAPHGQAILDGYRGANTLFLVNTQSRVQFINFTFQNFVDDSSYNIAGGAMSIDAYVTLIGVCFQSNTGGSGGAIYIYASGVVEFARLQFLSNVALTNGGAVFNQGVFADLPLDDSFTGPTLIMTNNQAGTMYDGNGGALFSETVVSIRGLSLWTKNTGISGGVICVLGGTTFLANAVITDNTNMCGGTVLVYEGNLTLTSSVMGSNTNGDQNCADHYPNILYSPGDVVALPKTQVRLFNTTWDSILAIRCSGPETSAIVDGFTLLARGSIPTGSTFFTAETCDLVLSDGAMYGITATSSATGYGVFLSASAASNVVLYNISFESVGLQNMANAIYSTASYIDMTHIAVASVSYTSGSILFIDGGSSASMSNSNLINLTVSCPAATSGTPIFNNGGVFSFINSTCINVISACPHCCGFVHATSNTAVNLIGSLFFNIPSTSGGVVYQESGQSLLVDSCTFIDVRALTGTGGAINFGGAEYSESAVVQNSVFYGVTVTGNEGGVIVIVGAAHVAVVNVTVFPVSTSDSPVGFAFYIESARSSLDLLNVTILGGGNPKSAIALEYTPNVFITGLNVQSLGIAIVCGSTGNISISNIANVYNISQFSSNCALQYDQVPVSQLYGCPSSLPDVPCSGTGTCDFLTGACIPISSCSATPLGASNVAAGSCVDVRYNASCTLGCENELCPTNITTGLCGVNNTFSIAPSIMCSVPTCGSVPEVANGGTSCVSSESSLTSCTVVCNSGYTLPVDSPSAFVCSCSQTWVPSTLACVADTDIVCSNNTFPSLPTHACATCSGDYYTSTCTIGCCAGYTETEETLPAQTSCQQNGQWSSIHGGNLTCVELPPAPPSANLPLAPSAPPVPPGGPITGTIIGLIIGGGLLCVIICATVVVVSMWRARRRGGYDRLGDGDGGRALQAVTHNSYTRQSKTPATVTFRPRDPNAADAPLSLNISITAGSIKQVALEDLSIIAKLGEGGFGQVFRVTQESSHTDMALKMFNYMTTQDDVDQFVREVTVHANLRHPHCLQFFGVVIAAQEVGFLTQLMASDLGSRRRSTNRREKLGALLGAVRGLAYLHSNGITHADLKPSNILVDALGNAVLADFGLSGVRAAKGYTLVYAAPEVIAGGTPDSMSDVFSMAIVILETLTGVTPEDRRTSSRLTDSERRALMGNRELEDLVSAALASVPTARPVVSKFVHPLEYLLERR